MVQSAGGGGLSAAGSDDDRLRDAGMANSPAFSVLRYDDVFDKYSHSTMVYLKALGELVGLDGAVGQGGNICFLGPQSQDAALGTVALG